MIIPKVGIIPNYILNNTGADWFEFQDAVQYALGTSLHCLPHNGELKIILSSREHDKFPNLYYEIWARVYDLRLDVAIIKSVKPKQFEDLVKGGVK